MIQFNLQKYLSRNKYPSKDKYLDINDCDFVNDEELMSLVDKEGIINDTRYNVQTGIVTKEDELLKVEFRKGYGWDN